MKQVTRRTFLRTSTSAAVLAALGLSGCGAASSTSSGAGASSTSQNSTPDAAKVFKVGIVNWVDHASLNQIVASVKEELDTIAAASAGAFSFDYASYEANAQADGTILNQIAADFIADAVDVIVAVATPCAVVMQNATEDTEIPVIYSAVSDPVIDGLTENPRVTGTSDALNAEAMMNLMLTANPDVKKVGLLYDIGQSSATKAIADAKAYCDAKGISYVEKNGANSGEVLLAVEALVAAQVDAIFTPTDNTIMTAELAIYETLQEAKIPHYGGADSFALNGAFCGYGVDYVQLGTATAQMVAKVLCDGVAPADMPFQTFDNGIVTINTETCEAMGFDLATIKEDFAPLSTELLETTTEIEFEQ